MQLICQQWLQNPYFERAIIGLIIAGAVSLGLETVDWINRDYGAWIAWFNRIIIGLFVIEALIKMVAVAPQLQRYFGDGWNLFDFSIIVLSLLPTTGQFAMIARLARLLRVMRLISAVPKLRLIVSTLVRSLPSMAHVVLLMSVIFYIYAVAGYHWFHAHDPEHWGNLGLSLLTLFRVVTLEDWTDVMYTAMDYQPIAWLFFVSFVIVGTFVIVNLFIAVVINNLEEAKHEQLDQLRSEPTNREIMHELEQNRKILVRLSQRLDANRHTNRGE